MSVKKTSWQNQIWICRIILPNPDRYQDMEMDIRIWISGNGYQDMDIRIWISEYGYQDTVQIRM